MRDDEGWRLTPQGVAVAPMLRGKHLYGPASFFSVHEIAWYRREAIVHLLASVPGGLQIMEIVRELEELDWVPGPKVKDSVKADVVALQEDKRTTRDEATKKWVVRGGSVRPQPKG